MLHSVLSKLPKPLNLESLLTSDVHPPSSLSSWRHIPACSVLKTAQSPAAAARQKLEDGAVFYQAQTARLRREEMRRKVASQLWRYRRPIGSVGLAVMVGLLSWWIRRSTSATGDGSAAVAFLKGSFPSLIERMHLFWSASRS